MTAPQALTNRSDDVERYLAALDHPLTTSVVELRNGILASNGQFTERIKWNAPSFCFKGEDRVTFRFPPKGGFQIIFHRGAKVKDATSFRFEDDSGLLEWAAPDRAIVTFRDADSMCARQTDLISLINRWMLATT